MNVKASRGITTNGIGQRTTVHLNLTRTMADRTDWDARAEERRALRRLHDERQRSKQMARQA